ncbi:hypothetical protein EDD16DRAFT_1542776 [Pisolithus croceorrhizus]|nr:hypothetical protein EV401DRAFT_2010715 [Pisolithus croceorrhizus]KAI6130545.1 hypothetical protein EDD16DRAFT_1542776 [Pisolithus croceorrhizus]
MLPFVSSILTCLHDLSPTICVMLNCPPEAVHSVAVQLSVQPTFYGCTTRPPSVACSNLRTLVSKFAPAVFS